MTLWLAHLGGKVVGISNSILTKPSHYKTLNFKSKIKSLSLDLKDYKKLKKVVLKEKPDFIFHLAAQALVKKSFSKPKHTYILKYNWDSKYS